MKILIHKYAYITINKNKKNKNEYNKYNFELNELFINN